VLKKAFFVVLALVLLALPLAARWFYFYDGQYEPGEVTRPDLQAIEASLPEMDRFVDQYAELTPGTILVDMAHANRFAMAELAVLQARLASRGQQLELVEDASNLAWRLRDARALIVISPGENWTPGEIRQVQGFVENGGRLLLVTDPTRFEIDWDFLVLDNDVQHINDLAAQFGLLFQAGYLYNTVEGEGNFRNIKLDHFTDHELTEGLERVVFYAARSIVSDEQALIAAGGDTRSSASERADELAVAVLAADGAVLALGDLSFATEPHNAVYDNDQFVANIADFLASAERRYELADFPLFFGSRVALVYTGDPLLDSDLLLGGSDLQAHFAGADKELVLMEEEDETLDTLFLGLYEESEDVEAYLAAAQVTLHITPTELSVSGVGDAVEGDAAPESIPDPLPELTPTPVPTEPLTTTLGVTHTPGVSTTPAITNGQQVTVTAEISPSTQNRVEIESFGEMVLTGTSMLILQGEGDRHVLLVLADTKSGLESAMQRLIGGDLAGCVLSETETPTMTALALCSTGEVVPGEGGGGWQEPEPELVPPTPVPPPPITDTVGPVTGTDQVVTDTVEVPEPVVEPEGSILVISLDDGEGRYDSMTSANDYEVILGAKYEVTVWSKAQDGALDPLELTDYDLVIWTAGDYEDAMGDDESDALFILMLEGVPVVASGAYIGDTGVESTQRDIRVSDPDHPMTAGFGEQEVISFVSAPSGSEYETSVLDEIEEWDTTLVPFVRGPESEDAGAPAIYVIEEELTGMQLVLIGFPIYLLPEEAKSQFVLSLADWMVSQQ
jgi:hypothetical protein